MDPNALLKNIRSVAAASWSDTQDEGWELDDLGEMVDNLRCWIKSGGFEPEWDSEFERACVLKYLPPDHSRWI